MRVAIIGGGFCGLALALRLTQHAGAAALDEICLVEPGEHLGPGVAYGTPHAAHLLNVRAGDMGADADDPGHFARYLATEGVQLGGDFAARGLYGRYLRAYAQARLGHPRWQARVRHARARALDVVPGVGDGPATVHLDDGTRLVADRVALCIGNTQARLPRAAGLAALAPPRALLRPWQWETLAELPASGTVLLLGTGLTMVDVVLVLAERRFRGAIVALSRRGLAPRGHLPAALPRPPLPAAMAAPLPPAALARALRSAATPGPWQAAVDALRPHTPALWAGLTPAQRGSFLRHAKPYWDSHRHRIAPAVAGLIERARASGQLRILAGRLRAVAAVPDGIEAQVCRRGSALTEVLAAQCVVNCTGADVDWRTAELPLLAALRRRGLLVPDPLGLGASAGAAGALHGADGVPSRWLFALGSALTGRDLESVAVPELREQARATADAWLT